MLTSADRNLYSHFYAKCGVWGHKMWHERVQLLSRKLAQYEHFVIAEKEFSFSLVKYLTFSKSTHLARRLVIAENCRFWGRVSYNPRHYPCALRQLYSTGYRTAGFMIGVLSP